jgi:hypothetical protein
MNELRTKNINLSNFDHIQREIFRKKSYNPYFADENTGSIVLTDYDNFPYKRWFRGIPESHRPIVAEREAGWRPVQTECYKYVPPNVSYSVRPYCFEPACSTVYPCLPDSGQENESRNVLINNSCIVEYR